MKRKSWLQFVLVALLAMVLVIAAACGGGSNESGSTGGSGSGDSGGQQQQEQPAAEKITIRFVGDLPTPPHPAAVAIDEWAKKLPETLPGAEVRPSFAGSLYDINEAMQALETGNLEMVWGQSGKAAAWDPRMGIPTVPVVYTTVGAMTEGFPQSEVAKYIEEHLASRGIKVFGWGDLSWYTAIGAKERLLTLDDIKGKKIRTFSPTLNKLLETWGGSPVTLAFGDVPSALSSGTIDGLVTSAGGWGQIKDLAPYYTVAGVSGVSTDFYYVAASQKWWDSLKPETQQTLEQEIQKLIETQKVYNWCYDLFIVEQFRTDDPSKPGIYEMTPEEVKPWQEAAQYGAVVADTVKETLPQDAHQWVDKFIEEGKYWVEQYPIGSHELEKMTAEDCKPYEAILKVQQ